MLPEVGVDTARRLAHNASAVVFVRDEAVREVVATALSELSQLLVFQTGSAREAHVALEHGPDVLVLGPGFRDREVEELLDSMGTGSPAVVLLVTHQAAGKLVLRHDMVAIEAPFDLDRLTWALEEAVRRHSPSGTLRRHEAS